MKAILYAAAFLAFGSTATAQTQAFKVMGGPDICRVDMNPDTFRLGAYPVVATPGLGTLTYDWHLLSGAPANGFLDTPTNEHPRLLPYMSTQTVDSLDFEVRVQSANGGIGLDTVRVYYAKLVCVTASCGGTINAGDTLQLFNPCTSAALAPLQYRWAPNEFLSESAATTPKTWTPGSRIYASIVTGRYGCRWHGECPVIVNATPPPPPPPPSSNGVSSPGAGADRVVIAPSPITGASVARIPAGWAGASFSVLASDGRLVQTGTCTGETVSLASFTTLPAGIYTFRLRSASGKTEGVRFEVR